MKKFVVLTAAIGLITGTVLANGEPAAEESSGVTGASLTVDVGSAYVFRGATVVDELVVQPAVEVYGFGMPEEYGEFTVGAWGSTAPFNDDTPSLDSIFETDWYVIYALPELVEDMDLYVSYTQYQYSFTPDEKELAFGIGYELGDFIVGGSANFMLDDRNLLTENQKYVDLYGEYELEIDEKSEVTFGALMGLMFQGDGNSTLGLDDGFNHFELEAAYEYDLSEIWELGASLAYIGQLDSNVLPDSAYDKGLVLFFSVGAEM